VILGSKSHETERIIPHRIDRGFLIHNQDSTFLHDGWLKVEAGCVNPASGVSLGIGPEATSLGNAD
jgi:hypothetical protein